MRSLFKRASFFLPFIAIAVLFYSISPSELITYVGTENSYVLMFITALIGGLSILVGVPYVALLVTFALGDLNPYLLAMVTATGVLIGDSTSYFLALRGNVHEIAFIEKYFERIEVLYQTHTRQLPLYFFMYGSFSPFPNDIITISSALCRYNFWKTIFPLFLGNLLFCTVIAKFAIYFTTLLS